MFDQELGSEGRRSFLEDLLTLFRIAEKGVSDDVGERSQIRHLGELAIERFRGREAGFLELQADAENLLFDFLTLGAGAGLGFELLNLRQAKRRVLDKPGQADPREALEDEMRSAILVADTGANQPETDDVMEIRGRERFGDAGFHRRDAKHALVLEAPGEHRPVARLEDKKRLRQVREQVGAGQDHQRDVPGQMQFLVGDAFHSFPINTTAERIADQNLCAYGGLVSVNISSLGFELVTVQSGVQSLRARENGETFHPVVGPMAEAVGLHVRQQRLVERANAMEGPFVIWDVGLGAAANAVAVIEAFAGVGEAKVELHSFDRTIEPLAFAREHAEALHYPSAHLAAIDALVTAGEWRNDGLHWQFRPGDFRQTMAAAPAPHAILYDPYSPQTNPELWTLEHFTAVRALLHDDAPCLLSNYTRSTAVRVTLLLAGFFVGRGHATGEKDQTTIASNDAGLIEDLLEPAWLERVRRSTQGAPKRTQSVGGPISDLDWARLKAHPQFAD